MRRIGAVLVVVTVVSVGSGPVAGAAPAPAQVVHPTGSWPADVLNVQAAADRGGSILLKSVNRAGVPTAFDFGTPESLPGRTVRLRTDVAIRGEGRGPAMTRIEGGLFPFFGVAKAHTRIEGIHFVGPSVSAIIVIASTGAEIVDNRVSSVVGHFLPFLGLSEGRGIKFLGNSDPDGAITGKVVVSGNVVEDMHADLSDAIVFDAVAADVEVVDNRIDTVQSSGMLLIDSGGSVHISGNHVAPGPGDPGEFSFGNGITILGSRNASYRITGNRIVTPNPSADGMLLFGDVAPIVGAVIEGNHLTMAGSSFGAVTFLDDVVGASVRGNVVDGSGATAFGAFVGGFSPAPAAVGNVFAGNRASGFVPSLAHLFLDRHTRDTRVLGCPGTVVDLGVGNHVVGCPSGGTGAGVAAAGAAAPARPAASIRSWAA